ncbi:hypothetical protein OQA88_794 [Cercophora sp. LCS_1]
MDPLSDEYRNRRRSFGRGGAGNIRSHAEATIPEAAVAEHQQRRRSSVWSMASSSSSASRRSKIFGSVKNLFGRTQPTMEGKEEDM